MRRLIFILACAGAAFAQTKKIVISGGPTRLFCSNSEARPSKVNLVPVTPEKRDEGNRRTPTLSLVRSSRNRFEQERTMKWVQAMSAGVERSAPLVRRQRPAR